MDVSIVVLTWEDFERTNACVRSLPSAAEVVVVDNGSAADISSALQAMCDETGARYLRSEVNLGYAKGMNLGVRHTTRSRVVLSNNDIVVRTGAVEELSARLDDPTVGAAFPTVLDVNGADQTAAGRFLTVAAGLAHATGLSLVLPRLRIVSPPEQGDWFSGPFVAIRRETLDAIGGVDESSFFYSEDLRLCWAVRRLGLRLAYVPAAVVTHEDDASAKRRWPPEEISRRQTREFIRASRELAGWRGRIACSAYTLGVLLRAGVGGGATRRAVARGAIEGLRAR
ncbi:glycosyltransferase family 2 protein [Verrucosispora sp. WMMA2044]|uniref:Glycosyltransferase family 2 protein n=1 Tax=Verrucosispora sioxanthis TaxID=2499994 RepID=A0A6M1KTL8_9ACTN|nr:MULTISPECIES: glycosyltransferase family 2 protein [Micromonospora]NEE62956.1 glycosyltransferase family 2 protein [Verrucosispora sioxanthis]NGM12066.1 glycosyltransferase family 2 protein [Verrucosispora sioxanthis]WBB47350.1 glycosyltransferase family 2 protein [Verrucosispora sp. WMMA2044]